jgi:hypothetical protein
MSYRDVPHNFSAILDHLKQGSKELASLFQFFKGVKSAFEAFSSELNRLSDAFHVQNPESSLTKSLLSLKKFFKHFVTLQLAFTSSLNTDLIEPLELFNDHFTINNQEITTRSDDILKPLKSAQMELRKIKKNYYHQSESLEKLSRSVINANNHLQIVTQKSNLERSVQILSENYKKCVDDVKIFTDIYESEMPKILDSLQQNEESRIHFIKSSSEKFVRFFQKMVEGSSEYLFEFNDSVTFVNSVFDIKNFVGRLENPMVITEEFVDYQSWKNLKTIDEVGNQEVVNSVIDFLILGKIGKFADFSRIRDILLTHEGKDFFIQGLESLKNNEKLEIDRFKKLAELLKFILMTLEDDERSQYHFCKIIVITHVFFIEVKAQKVYLSEELKGLKFWDNEKRWVSAVELAISAKLLVDKESSQRAVNAKKKPGFLINAIKDLAQKIPLSNKEKVIEKSEKSSAFGVLSNFAFQMSNLAVSSGIAKSIIIKISEHYMLESDRICTLLSQIQVERENQPSQKKSLKKSQIFVLILPFLTLEENKTLLTLNKSLNIYLQPRVYHYWLRCPWLNTVDIRRKHWINQLESHFPPTDYPALLQKISQNYEIIGEISEIIDMDVNRSYQDRSDIHQSLKNVLKTYAFYNPDVSYCQGMNFIAGTFLLLFRDEGLSFKCLIGLVKKFEMGKIFEVGVPKLRCMLYQLDQLIEIRLPNVHKVFKLEGVSSGYFSSPWFLTIFSSNLQNRIKTLHEIWDYFFIKGWKVVFKASIAILKILEPKIVRSSFDEIMSLITGSNLISEEEIFNERFIEVVKKVKVTKRLLMQIEQDYQNILQLSKST